MMFGFERNKRDKQSDFESLALEHMDALYGSALRLTRNPKDAEDLVQDAYLRAFRFFHRFEQGTNFKAWIFKILTNTFINKYRRKVKEKEVAEKPAEEIMIDRFVSGERVRALQDPEALLRALPRHEGVVVEPPGGQSGRLRDHMGLRHRRRTSAQPMTLTTPIRILAVGIQGCHELFIDPDTGQITWTSLHVAGLFPCS